MESVLAAVAGLPTLVGAVASNTKIRTEMELKIEESPTCERGRGEADTSIVIRHSLYKKRAR